MDNLEEMDKFLEKYNFPKLNKEEIENLNRLIKSMEIETVLRNLPASKSPGPDGFIAEFYQKFREDLTGDRSKVQCCKEQYCIGTWNVRSMNQGKLEIVKQEMARVNINITGISELKWTGMSEFNSDDH